MMDGDSQLIDMLQVTATFFESDGKFRPYAPTIRQAVAEIRRLSALVNEQSHAETYGRRSGGGKEILFK